MQKAANNLLTGSRWARDENSAAGGRYPVDLLPELICGRRDADEIEVAPCAKPQLLVLASQLSCFDRPLDDQ
jgi:hypothetical protein